MKLQPTKDIPRYKTYGGFAPTPKLRVVIRGKGRGIKIEQLFEDDMGNPFWAPIPEVNEQSLPEVQP